MLMGVAFLLDRSGVIVDRQTVGDQDAAKVFSQDVVEEVTAAALSNDIEGEQLGRKNPQPPARAGDPPAGLIARKRRCLAQFCRQSVVWGFYFGGQPIHRLREPTGAELQAEAIAQNGTGFAHGKAFGLVEIGRQSKGSWAKRSACKSAAWSKRSGFSRCHCWSIATAIFIRRA